MGTLGREDHLYIEATLDMGIGEQRARFINEMDDAMRAAFVKEYLEPRDPSVADEFNLEELIAMLVDHLPEASDYINAYLDTLDEEIEYV